MAKSRRKMSAPQAVAMVLMIMAVVMSAYGAYAGHNVLIVIAVLDLGMAMVLWRIKPKTPK